MTSSAERLSRLEFAIMETLWSHKDLSIREVLDRLVLKKKPTYITVQTTMYRMEAKGIIVRTRRVSNFHLFQAVLARDAAQKTVLDELLSYFGGESQPVMAYLVEAGKLSIEDVRRAEQLLHEKKSKKKRDTSGRRA